jgi:large subunit ribosomal protein L3
MNIPTLFGTKIDQKQTFLEDGTRVPVSLISVRENVITQIKTVEKDGYLSLQLGQGSTTKANNPKNGIAKKAGLSQTPRFLREIRIADNTDAVLGATVKVEEVFEAGDIVNVAGTSKGKGYAGVVKRHGFHGGPKTHGQSDRHRAPGSIGQSATPGRVYKGKRMAGRMGNERVTVRNLMVLDIVDGVLYIKGLVPGPRGTLIEIKKVGHDKKYTPVFKIVEDSAEQNSVEPSDAEAMDGKEVAVEAPVVDSVEPTVDDNVAEDKAQAEEVADEATGVTEETTEKEEAK